jgi:hypothetical protein
MTPALLAANQGRCTELRSAPFRQLASGSLCSSVGGYFYAVGAAVALLLGSELKGFGYA